MDGHSEVVLTVAMAGDLKRGALSLESKVFRLTSYLLRRKPPSSHYERAISVLALQEACRELMWWHGLPKTAEKDLKNREKDCVSQAGQPCNPALTQCLHVGGKAAAVVLLV